MQRFLYLELVEHLVQFRHSLKSHVELRLLVIIIPMVIILF